MTTIEYKNHWTEKINLLLHNSEVLTVDLNKKIAQYAKSGMKSKNSKIWYDTKPIKPGINYKHKASVVPALISPNAKLPVLRRKTLPINTP